MKPRFFLIIIMLSILFGGWQYLSYESMRSLQAKLDDISRLPIYAYVADTTKVEPLMRELKSVAGIKTVVHETAHQAATELITAYGLPLNEEMIEDYSFPDIITISLQPTQKAIKAKAVILDILRARIAETDIDSQASAYNDLADELKLIQRRNISFTAFAFVLMLLTVVFSRLSFELHVLLHYQGKKHSVIDKIRHQEQGVRHTWAMLLIPLPLCIATYFILVFSLHLPQIVPYWVFIAQLVAALTGTLITHFTLHTFDQEISYNENPVQILTPEISTTEANNEATDT
ncbi:MAG: hypothetical protein PHO32_10365 [Candidatus Cloacimonetes bacterium]|nr:hypothetical protein [Candidatus Cloacimonadota bacterium]